ncbi:hypothetical protein GCM10008090_08680 [Arenicella chitinivorans]|uniref:DUF975 family protein n=1 Tax=Arenicella chitinivorans TaxID=1329800 RepID=A0A918VHI9_9GAMM|nr:hypothetical protein [Arenicella chitinivorans]GHA01766.1 hypothetical protein GCM10008090_08680 [Arenicella chitinivorans]
MSDIYKAPQASLNEPTEPGQYGSLERGLAGQYELKPVEVIKQAWAMLPGMKSPFWIAAIIYGMLSLGFSFVTTTVAGDPATGSVNWVGYIAMNLLQMIVLTPVAAGLMMIGVKHAVGAPVNFNEIYQHFDKTMPLFLTMLLMYILIIIGFILLIIPGLYLSVGFALAMPLVIDKRMGPIEALTTSCKAITHKWFSFFGFWVLSLLVVIAGFLALFVGVIWAYPLVVLAIGIIYRDVFGVEPHTVNPPN